MASMTWGSCALRRARRARRSASLAQRESTAGRPDSPPPLGVRSSGVDSEADECAHDLGDGFSEGFLVFVAAALLDWNIDSLGDYEGFRVHAVIGDEARAALEVSLAVEEVLVQPAFLLHPRREVVVVPLVVPPDAPHAGDCITRRRVGSRNARGSARPG